MAVSGSLDRLRTGFTKGLGTQRDFAICTSGPVGDLRSAAYFAGATGSRPASEEGKLELTEAPQS